MSAAARKPLTFNVDRNPPPPVSAQPRQQVGARVTATVYRQLKAKAALQGVAVGALVEQAIAEFLARADDRAKTPPDGSGRPQSRPLPATAHTTRAGSAGGCVVT